MQTPIFPMLLATLLAAPLVSTPQGPPAMELVRREASYDWRDGASGHRRALADHERKKAPLLVYFRTDWCPHCRNLDALLLEQRVVEALGPFAKVRVNPEAGRRERSLFEDYGGRGYPALYVVAPGSGRPRRVSHSGPAEDFVARVLKAAGQKSKPSPKRDSPLRGA